MRCVSRRNMPSTRNPPHVICHVGVKKTPEFTYQTTAVGVETDDLAAGLVYLLNSLDRVEMVDTSLYEVSKCLL